MPYYFMILILLVISVILAVISFVEVYFGTE